MPLSGRWSLGPLILLLSTLVTANQSDLSLYELSLEELLEIEVISASRSSQKLSQVSSAVFVIDKDMIEQSGASTVPDLLALSPGIDVNRIFTETFSVSMRGFQSRYTNKLLVLIDGRSVYTPLYGGVLWELQTLPVQEIERIEVLRGSAGSVWGVNAMNGVINIITRDARSDSGKRLQVELGNHTALRKFFSTTHEIKENGAVRISAQRQREETLQGTAGDNPLDKDPEKHHARLRADWEVGQWNYSLQVANEYYRVDYQSFANTIALNPASDLNSRLRFSNTVIMGNAYYNHASGKAVDVSPKTEFQFYHEQGNTIVDGFLRDVDTKTTDLEVRHNRNVGRHRLSLGAGYREWHLSDQYDTYGATRFTVDTTTAFIQDQIHFNDNQHLLTVGAKIEDTYFSGNEVQPSIRWLTHLSESLNVWASWSKSVRTPSFLESAMEFVIVLPNTDPDVASPIIAGNYIGSPDVKPEVMHSSEMGFRYRISGTSNLDVTLFHQDYDDLIDQQNVLEIKPFPGLLNTPIPTQVAESENMYHVTTSGIEAVVRWRPVVSRDFVFGYDYTDSSGRDVRRIGPAPQHRAKFFYSERFTERFDFSLMLQYTSDYTMPSFYGVVEFDEYATTALSFGYLIEDGLMLRLVGRNLIDKNRVEAIQAIPLRVTDSHRLSEQWMFEIDWTF